jgi:hypothetical protein
MNVASLSPGHHRPSPRRRRNWRPARLDRPPRSAVRAAAVLVVSLAPLGALGCGAGQPGSVTQGCRDLASSQDSAAGDIWGEVAADAHGTPLGQDASDLEKLTVIRASPPAYRTDLRKIIALCGRAGITV